MSERGSFVTEYIGCSDCLEAAKAVLLENEKYLCSTIIPSWEGGGKVLPIIAGKISGSYQGEELHWFEHDLAPKLAAMLCHPLRVAIVAECGEQIFTVTP